MGNETRESISSKLKMLEKERENYQRERAFINQQEENINFQNMQMAELINQKQFSGAGNEKLQSLLSEQREVQEQIYQNAMLFANDEKDEQAKLEKYYRQQEDDYYDKMQQLLKEENAKED